MVAVVGNPTHKCKGLDGKEYLILNNHNISAGMLITVKYTTANALGSGPIFSHVLQERPVHQTLEELLKGYYPFYLAKGRSISVCKGCGKKFALGELRVKFSINCKRDGVVIPAWDVAACLKVDCLQNIYAKSKNIPQFPKFDGSIVVPQLLFKEVKQLGNINGITWQWANPQEFLNSSFQETVKKHN